MLENLKIASKSDMVDLVFCDFFNSLVEFGQYSLGCFWMKKQLCGKNKLGIVPLYAIDCY